MYGIVISRKDDLLNGNKDGTMDVRVHGRMDFCMYGRVEGWMEIIIVLKIIHQNGC